MSHPITRICGSVLPGTMTLLLPLPLLPPTALAELRTKLAPLPERQGVAGALVGLSGGALIALSLAFASGHLIAN